MNALFLTLFILAVILIFLFRSKKIERKYLYFEHELEPGMWAHNDSIAVISIQEIPSVEVHEFQNADEAWSVANVETEKIPGCEFNDRRMTITTNNGRRWIYEMSFPSRWEWLIELPLVRFLNDAEYRHNIETKVSAGEGDADTELLVACCLLHAPDYHFSQKEKEDKRRQLDMDQAEKLLKASADKGNDNALFELACLYFSKGEHSFGEDATREFEKAITINKVLKRTTRRGGIWFIDRYEGTLKAHKNNAI